MADITIWWKNHSNLPFFACFVLQRLERTETLSQSPWNWAVTQTQSGYWAVNPSLMESSWTGFWFPDERNTHLSHCSLSPFSICARWDDAWTCCSYLAIMKWKKKMRAKCHHTKESKEKRQKGVGPLASLVSAYFQVSCCPTHRCQYCLNPCWSVSAAWGWKHSWLIHAASKNTALMMKLSLLT